MFQFKQYPNLTDGNLLLEVKETISADREHHLQPEYRFRIFRSLDGVQVGGINLRIGDSDALRMYNGHIGYGIDAPFRGNHYAALACRIVAEVAIDHGLETLWLTCIPENIASRRTCELAGAEFVEVIDVPKAHAMYQRGVMQLCRYRWKIG